VVASPCLPFAIRCSEGGAAESLEDRRVKLDLHTHCREATACPTPTVEIARRIVAVVRARGLDGIGITEHYTKAYGYAVKRIVEEELHEELLVIPGQEIDRLAMGIGKGMMHVVELYLPGDLVFRFIAHPGHPYVVDLESLIDGSIHGIELRNANHDGRIDEGVVRELARKHDLLLLANSDAHSLEAIGTHYNEIGIEELCARAGAL